jgi:hypothetical protein
LSEPTPPAQPPAGPAPRKPWWRISPHDVAIVVLLATLLGWWHWPRQPPGPVQLLQRGTVGGTAWSVLAQRAGSGVACLQVRVDGARRALMCDQHWDRDVHLLWHGPLPPPSAGSTIGPPSLLRVRFPGTGRTLVVSVLYDEIATLRTPSIARDDGLVLRTTPLFDTDFRYVVAVLTTADATELRAFAADGEPIFYNYVDPLPE